MIADREQLPLRQPRAAQVLGQLHLHRVRVLQLVHEQVREAPLEVHARVAVAEQQVARA